MSLDYFATQAGNYTAEVTRRAMFFLAARTGANSPGILAGGLASPTDLQVTAPASGMTVNIGVGEGLIGGTEGGSQGGYTFRNSSSFSAVVATANGSLPRVDAVVATMADAGYTQPSDVGGTSNGPVLAVVTGTPTSGANVTPGSGGYLSGAPSVPASSLLLAWLLVPAAATSIVTGDILNVAKVVNLGGAGLNFLQLPTPIAAAVTWGSGSVSWPGGVPLSNTATITHGLPRTPATVYVSTSITSVGTYHNYVNVGNVGSTTFQFQAWATQGNPAASETASYYWMAVA